MEQEDQKVSDKGLWWLPDNPNARLHGTVTYGQSSGLELDLVGSLFPTETTPQFHKSFSVWGTTVRGKNISLVKAHLSSVRTHVPGLPTTRVAAYEGVVGGFYRSLDDVIIHTVTVDFDYLAPWAVQSGVTQQYEPKTRTSLISVQAPPEIVLGHANGIDLRIAPFVSQTQSRNELVLRDAAELRLEGHVPRPYPNFERIIGSFRTFLTLAVGEPAGPKRIVGQTSEKIHEIEGTPIWGEVEIIRQRKRAPAKELYAEEMLFTLKDLGPQSGVTIESFLNAERRLKPALDLFLLNYFYPEMPPPQEFLNFLNAIEVLHSVTIGGQYQTDEEYQSGLAKHFRRAVPDNVPDEFRQSLEVRLSNLHRYTLRKRLRDVLHKFEPIVSPYIDDVSRFADLVTTLRNALLHSSDQPAPSYAQLWQLSQLLGLILEAALLCEVGFRTDMVRTIIGRGKRARLAQAKPI